MGYLEKMNNVTRVKIKNSDRLECGCREMFEQAIGKKIVSEAIEGKQDEVVSNVLEFLMGFYRYNETLTNKLVRASNDRPLGLSTMKYMLVEDILSVLIDNKKVDFDKYVIDFNFDNEVVNYYTLNVNNLKILQPMEELHLFISTLGVKNTILLFLSVNKILGE